MCSSYRGELTIRSWEVKKGKGSPFAHSSPCFKLQMLEQKPKGIWLTRIHAEYKNIYHEELHSETLENLKHLPHIARFEV